MAGFLAAEDVGDWVVLHGGAMAVFRVPSLVEAVRLAEAVAQVSGFEGAGVLMTIADDQLTVRLTRDIWQLEQRHVHLARAVSAVARAHGAVVDRTRAQEVSLAIAAQPDTVDVGFWRAVLGYAGVADDNAVDPLGHGSTVWMQDLDPAKPLRHAMHVDVSVAREQVEERLAAALAAGGRIVDDWNSPGTGRSPTAPATAYASARGPMVSPVLPPRDQNPQDPTKIARPEQAQVLTCHRLLTSEGCDHGVAIESQRAVGCTLIAASRAFPGTRLCRHECVVGRPVQRNEVVNAHRNHSGRVHGTEGSDAPSHCRAHRGDAMRRTAAMIATAVLTCALAACGNARESKAGAAHEVAASAASPSSALSTIRIVAEQDADLHLWMSNQSFEDASVVLKVSIDGIDVVAQPFDVRSQHNWVLFPITAPPGDHVLVVVSDTGAELRENFTLPEEGRQYAAPLRPVLPRRRRPTGHVAHSVHAGRLPVANAYRKWPAPHTHLPLLARKRAKINLPELPTAVRTLVGFSRGNGPAARRASAAGCRCPSRWWSTRRDAGSPGRCRH